MTDKSAAAVREFCERWSQEWNENTGWYKSQIMYDKMLPDLTALISEGYVSKEEHDKVVQQRDELREALAEQKRLYFNLFDEEIRCMYCEAEISRGSAIILCKECAENTEL